MPDSLRFLEEVLVPSDLNQQKGDVDEQRDDDDAGCLNVRHASARGCLRIVGEDEAEHAQRDDHREVSGGALEIVSLLAVAQPAQEQCQTAGEVDHDHVGAEQRIAPDRRPGVAGQHGDADQHAFEADDRESQDERAERLAEELGERIRDLDGPEGGPHHGREQPEEQHGRGCIRDRLAEPCAAEQEKQRHRDPGKYQAGNLRHGVLPPFAGASRRFISPTTPSHSWSWTSVGARSMVP